MSEEVLLTPATNGITFYGIKMLDLKEFTPEFGQILLLYGEGSFSIGRLEHIFINEKGRSFSFLDGYSSFDNVYRHVTHYLPADYKDPIKSTQLTQ